VLCPKIQNLIEKWPTQLLFVFLTLGNLFIFLGDDHDTAAEVVYIARMLWTSVG
jgi:hypothetical protein